MNNNQTVIFSERFIMDCTGINETDVHTGKSATDVLEPLLEKENF